MPFVNVNTQAQGAIQESHLPAPFRILALLLTASRYPT